MQLLDCLSRRELVLVAYDADKDNTPCELGGARAHWAVVRGAVSRDDAPAAADGGSSALTRWPAERRATDQVWLRCTHSKSKRTALWCGAALLASAAQLRESDGERRASGRYVMSADLSQCLASRVVVLRARAPKSPRTE